jgi:lipopolysaccharide heptosyltransferase II
MDYAIYLFYRLFCSVVGLLPLKVCFRLGTGFGWLAHLVGAPYRRLVLDNLRIAFGGEKTEAELRALARQHFLHLGANVLSSIKVGAMPSEEVLKQTEKENFDLLKQALSHRRGVIMVISHIGNWEMFAQLAGSLPDEKGGTIYQALGNRFIDAHIKAFRGRFGVRPFDRKDGFNAPIAFLREGGLLGILVDQHAGDGGLWTPFFGRLASTSPLAAILASRTGALLVPVAIYTKGVARWRMAVSPPLETAPGATPEQITAQINQALEAQIRVSPQDWFWVHNRWKTPSPRFLLSGYKRGIAYPPGFESKQLKPFRILVRSSNWLGDAVMTLPAVQAIKRGRPDVHLAVLTKAKLADFWRTVPEVDEILSIEPGDSVFKVADKIRSASSTPFDAAVLLPNSVRVALEAWLADIPRRVGYRTKWRSKLLNQIVPEPKLKKNQAPPQPRHQSHHYLDLAKFIGANVDSAEQAPSFSSNLPQSSGRVKIALCPGADYGPAKRWLPEGFVETAQKVAEARDCEWVLVGMPSDAEIGAQIEAALPGRCSNRIGKTTLAELIEELRLCRLLLTNDTGTMHLAAYLGIPTVSIFGSTEPLLTGPMGNNHRVLRHHVECSPCFLRECPLDFRCMKSVSVEETTEAVLEAIKQE